MILPENGPSDKKDSLPPYTVAFDQRRSSLSPPLPNHELLHTLHTLHPSRSNSTLRTAPRSASPSSSCTPFQAPCSPRAPTAPPQGIQPTNHLYVHRENAGIHGTYVLDPALFVPPCLLTPLAPGEERTNATLATCNGSITVDVWVGEGYARERRRYSWSGRSRSGSLDSEADLDEQDSPGAGPDLNMNRASIDVKSDNGSVHLKLHAPRRQRLRVTVSSAHGPATIELPRTFSGPIYTKSNIYFSAALEEVVTAFSDDRRNGRFFIGDYSGWKDYGWVGDELSVESRNASVAISFVDEPYSDVQRGSGLLGKLLNRAAASSHLSLPRLGG